MNDFVSKEVMELKLALLEQKLDQVLEVSHACLAEQKKTNGTVRRHETTLTRIWAIGSTAWFLIAAFLGWDFIWRRP